MHRARPILRLRRHAAVRRRFTLLVHRTNLTLLAACLALAAVVAAAGCAGKRQVAKKPEKPEEKRPRIGVAIKGSETVQEDSEGRRLWRIVARETRLNEATGKAEVVAGEVEVYGEKESLLHVQFADLAASLKNRRLFASGGISARSEEADTSFTAERITVDLKTNTVTASGGVRGSTTGGSFSADRLESDLRFTRIRLSSPTAVTGVIDPALLEKKR